MRVPLSSFVARQHPPTASADAIRAACEARAAAAALAYAEDRETVPNEVIVDSASVGGFYPEKSRGLTHGTSQWETLRDCAGPIAQIAVPLILGALMFLR